MDKWSKGSNQHNIKVLNFHYKKLQFLDNICELLRQFEIKTQSC